MAFSMEGIVLGQQYTAKDLAALWGYQSHHALIKGILTPANEKTLVLFVTREKSSDATQYNDEINGNLLYMMGQIKHKTDKRLLQNLNNDIDDIFLFYREKHHTPFTFLGPCTLIDAKIKKDSPSEFVFLLNSPDNGLENEDSLVDFLLNSNASPETIGSILEGSSKVTQHIRYERNPINRKIAIQIHGAKCSICGFDYNAVYGKDLANSYIEVHHIIPLAEGVQAVDPSKDLIPVCANCHRMLHRKKNNNISVEDLAAKFNNPS